MIQEPETEIFHEYGYGSVGFWAFVFILPKNVSFTNLQFSEGECTATKTGFYIGKEPTTHPQGQWKEISNGNSENGCWVVGEDFPSQTYAGPFSSGTFQWIIPLKYRSLGSADNGIVFDYAEHYMTMAANGTATIQKKGVGPFSKDYP